MVLSGDNSKVTSEVNRLLAELPASVHALTGVDLSKVRTFQLWWELLDSPQDERLAALTPSLIPADTTDQECHWCAGVRLLTLGLQQLPALPGLFSSHGDNESITDSGALFRRDQKCCEFRPSLAIFPSLLSAVSFFSTPSH